MVLLGLWPFHVCFNEVISVEDVKLSVSFVLLSPPTEDLLFGWILRVHQQAVFCFPLTKDVWCGI